MKLRNKFMLAGLMLICSVKMMGMQRAPQESIWSEISREILEEIHRILGNLATLERHDLVDELWRVTRDQQDRLSDDCVRQLTDFGFASITSNSPEEGVVITTLINPDGTMPVVAKEIFKLFLYKLTYHDGSEGYYITIFSDDGIMTVEEKNRITRNLHKKKCLDGRLVWNISYPALVLTKIQARLACPSRTSGAK